MAEIVTLHTAAAGEKPGFCRTPTAVDILNALGFCYKYRKMGCIVGGPGVGKSTAIAEYARENRDATVCRMTKATTRMQPGLARIVNALGGYVATQMGSADLAEEAKNRLCGVYRPQLLILDEAQHMDDELLEAMRDLFDESGAGIVLVGSSELPERWEAKSAARRRKWAQLTSRLTVWLDVPSGQPEDVVALCDHHGIAGKRSRDLLTRAASVDGGLRNIAVRLDIAWNLANGAAIELCHLETAELIIGGRK